MKLTVLKEQQIEMKEDLLISLPPTLLEVWICQFEKTILAQQFSGKDWQEDVLINLRFTCLKIGLRNFSILDTYIAASKLEV